jgi:hypothetical protein
LRQGLTIKPRLASNSWSSYLSLLSTGMTCLARKNYFLGRRWCLTPVILATWKEKLLLKGKKDHRQSHFYISQRTFFNLTQ